MADVAIYASVESTTPKTRAEWQEALQAVTAHPIISAINGGGGIHPANQVSLTVKALSAHCAVLSFIMLGAQRDGMRDFALGLIQNNYADYLAWCVTNLLDPTTITAQYSYVFTQGAMQAGVSGVVCLVKGFDEDAQIAVDAMSAYVQANQSRFYGGA